MSDLNPFAEAFQEHGQDLLENEDVRHEWVVEPRGQHIRLIFPRQSETGFDVVAKVGRTGARVYMGDFGMHMRFDPMQPQQLAEAVFGLLRDLLTEDMRLRVWLAGRKPCRAELEVHNGKSWVVELQWGRLFYNYFKEKREQLYQNSQLPGRLR